MATNQGKRRIWKLTTKGRLIALKTAARMLVRNRRRQHPGQQWLVIFDIPERQRQLRDIFRHILYGLGGRYRQRSVFQINDRTSYQLVKHLCRVAKLDAYVILVEVKQLKT